MSRQKSTQDRRRSMIIGLSIITVITALFLEAGILNNVNNKNIHKTSRVLLDQVINIIEKNEKNENEMIESLKDDYIIRAKAVSYIIDANEKAEYDVEELQKIADLVSVDEIHLFDKTGKIYSGSIPEYYGYSLDSGEQISYFKPMLSDKKLTLCQDITPNTLEGRKMMYAMTWNESGERMVQVGIEPLRLLQELKQNEISAVVGNMPMYEGMSIYVADVNSGEIYGATNEEKVGKTLDEIGIPRKNADLSITVNDVLKIGGEKYSCSFRQSGKYVVGILYATSSNMKSNLNAILVVAVYLGLAAGFIIFMLCRVLKANREKNEQLSILSSMSGIYYSMHLVDLEKNSVVEYSAKNEVKEMGQKYSKADELMKEIMSKTVVKEYLDQVLQFTDIHTVADRMIGKKIISGEFIGKNLGWFRTSFITIEADESGKPVKVIFTTQSINEEKEKEEKLIYRSNTDELTNCYNRRAYEEDINKMNPEDAFVYISIDVNGLKTVNDTLGHAAGDELIQGAASCMKQCFGSYGKVYRIGGDEFVSIIFTEDNKLGEIQKDFDDTVHGWRGKIAEKMSVSCGYVLSKEKKWESVYEMAKTADARMYEDKEMHYRKNGVDRKGQKAAIAALGKLYRKIVELNLTNDSCHIIKMDITEQNQEENNMGTASIWMQHFRESNEIHPDDLIEYKEKTDMGYLKSYFESGRTNLQISYRKRVGNTYEPAVLEIVAADDYSAGNQKCFLYEGGVPQ